ncbi:hypothetical protein CHUAL_002319 [Chamberlinius hualienensis]
MANRKPYYIHQLSHSDLENISVILNQNDKWKELGSNYLHWSLTKMLGFQGRQNPTYEMLWEWAQQNATVLQLFQILSKMKQYYAMTFLKDYVGSEHHYLMNEGEKPSGAENWDKSYSFSVVTDDGRHMTNSDKPSFPRQSSSRNIAPNPNFQRPSKREPIEETEEGAVCGAKSYCSITKSDIEFQKPLRSKVSLDPKNFNRQEFDSTLPSKVIEFPRDHSLNLRRSHLSPPIVSRSINPPLSLDDNTKVPDSTVSSIHSSSSSNTNQKSAEEPPRSREPSPKSLIGDTMLPQTPYKDVELATFNFSSQKELGKGGFGIVYEGYWQKTRVAIKRIIKKVNPGLTSFEEAKLHQSYVELKTLNRYRHDNILPLYAYAMTDNELCLIYQYMVNGSLEDRLKRKNGTAALSWKQRLYIACGSARGIQYLHNCDKAIVHGDIKSANILLDEHMSPKIGDFGLAREGPKSHSHTMVSAVHGTQPYLPSDYIRNRQLSTKVDTYSFGVVLFELATGLRAYNEDVTKHKLLRDYVIEADLELLEKLRDSKAGEEMQEIFQKFIDIGKKCAAQRKSERPEMTKVFEDLENLKKDQDEKKHECDGFPYVSELLLTDYSNQEALLSSMSDNRLPKCVQDSFQTTAGDSSFGLSTNIDNSDLDTFPRNIPKLTELGTKDD